MEDAPENDIRDGDRYLMEVIVRGGPDQHDAYAVRVAGLSGEYAPQIRIPATFLRASKLITTTAEAR